VGNSYVNFTVKGATAQEVADDLARDGRRAIVAPAKAGFVVVYEQDAEGLAYGPIREVGESLSREPDRAVLAVLNRDDDALGLWLFTDGELTDAYCSDPEALQGEDGEACPFPTGPSDAGRFCGVLKPGSDAGGVEAALHGDYLFAVERHEELARILGLPPWSVGLGYESIANGELDGLDARKLIRVGEEEAEAPPG